MSISDPGYVNQLERASKNIFTSFSKRNFYERAAISATVLLGGNTPISPFMNFDYNLGGIVPKDSIRVANNSLIQRCDELWVFGEVSDGVLIEIFLAQKYGKPVKFLDRRPGERSSFSAITEDRVRLEDVSPWMWDWVRSGRDLSRWHPRLRFNKTYPIVYPAYSKRNFYWQMHISQFCLEHKMVPLNPFMLFRYFLGDSVPREEVYRANADIVRLSDALWAFGDISDGVLDEVTLKKQAGGKVAYFKIENTRPVGFRKISASGITFEDPELESARARLA
ncbi:MAG TPA: hypothetical protein VLH84_02120 [Patescibacteria group bacterium]|nr:hypothetical protein [Patescibacteria group bacterium]